METFRKETSHRNEEAYHEDLKKALMIGIHGENDALAKLGETQQLKAMTLSITTRGIGFGITQTLFTAYSINENIILPSSLTLYRISLALLEAKLEALKEDYPLVARNSAITYPYDVSSRLNHLAKTITVAPTPLVKSINALGIIKRDGCVYIPAVRDDLVDRDDNFVPRPESVMYSNLRKVVVALADATTPERVRTYFEMHNPIPGAQFEGHILLNPEEIMPEAYNYDDLQRDIRIVQPFLTKLQKHVPKLVAGTIDFKSSGKSSLFISNEMESLRIPNRVRGQALNNWYQDCLPTGNITTYYSKFPELTATDRLEGQINLFGEIPDRVNIRYPFYITRDPEQCPIEISSDYHGIHQVLYGT